MKSIKYEDFEPTGIIRRLDELGRVVIPKEYRDTVGLKAGDKVEILFDHRTGAVMMVPFKEEEVTGDAE